jgi:phosphohistidine phosphatase
MRALALGFDVVLTSPAARAAQTAAIVAAALPKAPKPRELPGLSPGVPAAEMLKALRPFLRRRRVLVVGHEPGLSRLACLLLTGSSDGLGIRLKKGGLIALDVHSPQPRSGSELRWILTPRQLRSLAGHRASFVLSSHARSAPPLPLHSVWGDLHPDAGHLWLCRCCS